MQVFALSESFDSTYRSTDSSSSAEGITCLFLVEEGAISQLLQLSFPLIFSAAQDSDRFNSSSESVLTTIKECLGDSSDVLNGVEAIITAKDLCFVRQLR